MGLMSTQDLDDAWPEDEGGLRPDARWEHPVPAADLGTPLPPPAAPLTDAPALDATAPEAPVPPRPTSWEAPDFSHATPDDAPAAPVPPRLGPSAATADSPWPVLGSAPTTAAPAAGTTRPGSPGSGGPARSGTAPGGRNRWSGHRTPPGWQQTTFRSPQQRYAGPRTALVMLLGVSAVFGWAMIAGMNSADKPVYPTVTPTYPTTRYTPPTPEPSVVPRNPGWTSLASSKHGLVYELPPSYWTPLSEGTMVGYERKGRVVAVSRVAAWRRNACASPRGKPDDRGFAGFAFVRSGAKDPRQAAVDTVRDWATVANTEYESGQAHPIGEPVVSTVRLARGGTITTAAIEYTPGLTSDYTCNPPRARIRAAVVQSPATGRLSVLVLASDQGVDGALTPADEDAVIASLRPL